MKRWQWLLLGLGLGVSLGLLIGWVIAPVQYYDTAPSALHPTYRDEYVRLVAQTYAVDHQLEAAQMRLRRLDADQPTAPLKKLTEQLIATEAPTTTLAPLIRLSYDLNISIPGMTPYLREPRP